MVSALETWLYSSTCAFTNGNILTFDWELDIKFSEFCSAGFGDRQSLSIPSLSQNSGIDDKLLV
jgi:hypothetical protein